MTILKLHTTTSTNTYLKEWISKENLNNYTIVATDNQTEGRGQRENTWLSESGKNLLFSMFIKFPNLSTNRHFEINQAVSLGIIKVMQDYVSYAKIKWPNDIMAENNKIAGILIENTVSKNTIKHSIIGVGINVNQISFSDTLTNVSSLKNELNKTIDRDKLLQQIAKSIKYYLEILNVNRTNPLEKDYLKNLYLWQKWSYYKDSDNKLFKGKIVGLSPIGKLQVELESSDIKAFMFKELVFCNNN